MDIHLQPPPVPLSAISPTASGLEPDDDFGDFSAAEDAFGASLSNSKQLPGSYLVPHQEPPIPSAQPAYPSAQNHTGGGSWSLAPLNSHLETSHHPANGLWSQPPAVSEPAQSATVTPPMAAHPVNNSLAGADEDDEFGSFSEAPGFPAGFGGGEWGKPQQLALGMAHEPEQSQPR